MGVEKKEEERATDYFGPREAEGRASSASQVVRQKAATTEQEGLGWQSRGEMVAREGDEAGAQLLLQERSLCSMHETDLDDRLWQLSAVGRNVVGERLRLVRLRALP